MTVRLVASLFPMLALAPAAAAEGSSARGGPAGALPLEGLVATERIRLDGEESAMLQGRLLRFEGRSLELGGRRFVVAFAGDEVHDTLGRPLSLRKALAEHPEGLCAAVNYVPARVSRLGADTATGLLLLVDAEGRLAARCPDEGR